MKNLIFILVYLSTTYSLALENSVLEKPINIKTSQSLATEKKNSYQIYYFWATWCPDCKEKLKTDLNRYQNSQTDFSTFSIEKDKDKIMAFTEKNNIPFSVYFDQERELQKQLKVFSVPTVILAKIVKNEVQVIKSITGKDWSSLDQELEILKKGMNP